MTALERAEMQYLERWRGMGFLLFSRNRTALRWRWLREKADAQREQSTS